MTSTFVFGLLVVVTIINRPLCARQYPNSCSGQADGVYYMKLSDDNNDPIIKAKCSNEYMIIDMNFDPNLSKYFSSYVNWYDHFVGPDNDDHVNWDEWYLSNDQKKNFLLSPDCNTCEINHGRQVYNSKSTYWMTGTIFGCLWITRNHNCDYNWESNNCYACASGGTETTISMNDPIEINGDTSTVELYSYTGICPHNVQHSESTVAQKHDQCVQFFPNNDTLRLQPSLGTNGEYCVCVQPSNGKYYNDDGIINNDHENVVNGDENEFENVNIKLYQKDFEKGTYRIKKSGIYTIMEDIIFDFGANTDDPNGEGSYFPTENDLNDYPGAGQFKDPFFAGWFAGITIEANNVFINLNGKKLSMSEYFYYQQLWFSIIEIGSQSFLPGNGPGNFGANPVFSSNVTIINGILGLSSHHGIHGNYNKNIKIENVNIKYFNTHGIQLNGFDNIQIKNCEIGPTSEKAFFTGSYGHARVLIDRYRRIALETEGESVTFYGEEDNPITMQDIVDELELQMNYAFNYVTKNEIISDQNDENFKSFKYAKKLFINLHNDGIPNGAAQYGIFLNTWSASVFTYNLYTNYYSSNALLENINIHGMKHNMKEIITLFKETGFVVNPLAAPLNIENIFSENYNKWDNNQYLNFNGDILSRAYIVSNKLSNNFKYLGSQLIVNNYLVAFALGENRNALIDCDNTNILLCTCNSDEMLHTGKGIQGLRLDGVENVIVKNINIYDNHDYTTLGKSECGNYDNLNIKYYDMYLEKDKKKTTKIGIGYQGHILQTKPMQIGFSGNMNQGININAAKNVLIENININDLTSQTGPTFGISTWPGCDNITLSGNININNIHAGTIISNNKETYSNLMLTYNLNETNKLPEICGLRIYYNYDNYTTTIKLDDNVKFNGGCYTGHIGCFGNNIDDMIHAFLDSNQIESCDSQDIHTIKLSINNDNHYYMINLNIWIISAGVFVILTIFVIICVFTKRTTNSLGDDYKSIINYDIENLIKIKNLNKNQTNINYGAFEQVWRMY